MICLKNKSFLKQTQTDASIDYFGGKEMGAVNNLLSSSSSNLKELMFGVQESQKATTESTNIITEAQNAFNLSIDTTMPQLENLTKKFNESVTPSITMANEQLDLGLNNSMNESSQIITETLSPSMDDIISKTDRMTSSLNKATSALKKFNDESKKNGGGSSTTSNTSVSDEISRWY